MTPETKRTRHRGAALIASCLALIGALGPALIPPAAAQPEQVGLTVGQVIATSGATAPPAATFTYRLTPTSADAPMPAGSEAAGYTFTITGTGETSIGIDFGWAQVSSYELTCVTGTKDGYKVDHEVFTIDVYALNDEPPVMIVHKSDGTKTDLAFTHRYTAPPKAKTGGTALPPTGANGPAMLIAASMLLALVVWRGGTLYLGKRAQKDA